ncbi:MULTISPECIES: hypothetical protein [Haloferax]|uniref:Uncharacterized protein n=1 Tax=Haloferax marinum TaxID=2666143 RepID=A0A6A8GAG6_9EURY|nr:MULTISPECIES: hypothetical protein [Haloferax]KAB1198180.1 hypothetical protein Hfx1150_11905 [Haloferax sp. CBA1150]MRW97263.1 hypothetical protein [Haloferax marinum]
MRYVAIFIIVLSTVAVGVPTPVGAVDEVTYEGALITMPAPTERKHLENTEQILSAVGIETKQHASMFFLRDGTQYLVLSDTEPSVGEATVSGVEVLPADGGMGIIAASDLDIDETGTKVPLEKVEKNPEQYKFQFIQVTGSITQLSHTIDAADGKYVVQESTAGISETREPFSLIEGPGREGRWATVNLSMAKQEGNLDNKPAGQLPITTTSIGLSNHETRWWMSTNATVNMVVLSGGNSGVGAVVGTVTPLSTKVSSLEELSAHSGEVVMVTTNAVGSSISSQETLLSATRCAPSSITNPVTGCLPVPTDGVVHSGVLFDPSVQKPTDLVYYAGVSNKIQNTPVTPEKGTYRLTGRVVDASRIDPRLEGSALIVYDRERVGGLATSSRIANQAESKLTEYIQEQQLSSESEWNTIEASASASASVNNQTTTPSSGSNRTNQTGTSAPTNSNTSDGNEASQETSQPPNASVVDAEFTQNPISSDSTTLQVTIENTGGAGSTIVDVTVGSSSSSEKLKVPAETTVTKDVSVDFPVPSSESVSEKSVDVDVEQIDVGTLTWRSPDKPLNKANPVSSVTNSLQKVAGDEETREILGVYTGLFGGVLLVSAVIVSLIDMVGKLLGKPRLEMEYELHLWVSAVVVLGFTYLLLPT